MYDASLKIWVEGYKAFSKGRYIGSNGGEYVIWEDGATIIGKYKHQLNMKKETIYASLQLDSLLRVYTWEERITCHELIIGKQSIPQRKI